MNDLVAIVLIVCEVQGNAQIPVFPQINGTERGDR